MLLFRVKGQYNKFLLTLYRRVICTETSKNQLEKSKNIELNNAQYPYIKDTSFRARKHQQNVSFHDEIRKAKTVEEKLIKVNMPKYWGYKVVQISDEKFPYNCLQSIQHYTRTIFDSENEMKDTLETQTFVDAIKNEVQDAVEYSYDYVTNQYPNIESFDTVQSERLYSQFLMEQINRIILNKLMQNYSHLQDVEVDYNPRHEAFWLVGGINPPKNIKKSRKGHQWQKYMAKDFIDRIIQYVGSPYLTLRHRKQIASWKLDSRIDTEHLSEQLPRYKFDPRTLGYSTKYQHVTSIPGYWPGVSNDFGYISYQSRAHMLQSNSYNAKDLKDVLHAHAIQSSYAWLVSQAVYHGFSTFDYLTYPMNTQTIITNGRDWSFYKYQLNTLLVHSDHVHDNNLVNRCRGTSELQLYQDFDKNGKCMGFNEEVLHYLIKFYINVPNVTNTQDLYPFLNDEIKYSSQYSDAKKRTFLDNTFKRLNSNRSRHLAIPEIYLWEKIYKIDNKTRQMEAKRRYFELGINPWKRTLDQHQKEYIPRALRTDGPKSRRKWKLTYYP